MAKAAPDAMIDSALDYVANGDGLCVCSTQPTSYAEAYTTYKLAGTSALTTGSYTIADAAGGGRQVTVAATTGLTCLDTTDALHVAIVGTGDSSLRYVTTCTSCALSSDGTVDVPAFVITIGDPT